MALNGADIRSSTQSFKVSVVTAVYNAAPFIRRSVEAAVAEPEVGEVILVEDCSPDESLEVCRKLEREFSKVRALQHPDKQNHGAGASRNLGITNARFDFIAFSDADNHYLPGRFRKDREILEANLDVDGVYNAEGNYYYSEKAKQTLLNCGYANEEVLTLTRAVTPEELVYVLLGVHPEVRGSFGTDSVTLRRRVFDKVGLFKTSLRLQQDVHLFFRLAAKCRLVAGELAEPVCLRGVHEQQRMTDTKAQDKYSTERWDDLWHWCREHCRDDGRLMSAFDLQYHAFRVRTTTGWPARRAFLSYVMRHPGSLLEPMGFFDIGLFEVFGRNWFTLHFTSFKNRLLRRYAGRRTAAGTASCKKDAETDGRC